LHGAILFNERVDASPLAVSEVFGPTLQGEGPSAGQRAGFVRLGRCNLACGFCDTKYTWDWDHYDPAVEVTMRTVDDVAGEVEAMGVPLVVVTGGEPLLQQSHLIPLLTRLSGSGHRIEIETAGTILPLGELVALGPRFNVSPKLANSGNALNRRYHPEVLQALAATSQAVFKFVVVQESDLDEVQQIVDDCRLSNVWIMPEGTDAKRLLERQHRLADAVIARGWHMTTRLHILLWGDERGR
jgi:7-cyano-7-deazaguanosine (preQ0) biosynthesis protein QueE